MPRRHPHPTFYSLPPSRRRFRLLPWLVSVFLSYAVGYFVCYERDGEVMAQVYRQRQLVRALTASIGEPSPSPVPTAPDHAL